MRPSMTVKRLIQLRIGQSDRFYQGCGTLECTGMSPQLEGCSMRSFDPPRVDFPERRASREFGPRLTVPGMTLKYRNVEINRIP